MTPNLQGFPPRRRKTGRRIAVLLVAYAILGFFILPPIVRIVAVKQLSKQLDREVRIEKVRLNPFTFSTTIRGLLIKDRDGQPFVSWDEVYVNFQLSSFLGHPWVFKEVSTTRPAVRVQMNKDYTLNFSDLITKFSTNAPPPGSKPSRPLALRIDRLHIAGATASLTDLTPRTPFRRVLGPLDITLENFRTDPDNKNPYSFAGTTDAGERFAWSGYFYLNPLRSQGDISLENLSLNKYASLYQDFVRFEIRDGIVGIRSSYRFELSASNRVASVTNASFALHSFKLAEPGSQTNIVELQDFSVTGVSADAIARRAEVASLSVSGGKLALQRDKSAAINVIELSKPAATATHAPGGILLLLRSVTNAVAMLLNSTNAWTATLREVTVRNCALDLADYAHARPALLVLDDIAMTAKNLSNVPGTNLTASLSLRWNTNGLIKTDVSASFLPPTADIQLTLDNLELHPLDPYLEPKLNVFILGSKLGMDGHIRLRSTQAELPEVTFDGDVRLDDFSIVDGALGEDLLRWGSIRFSRITANLNPPTVTIQQIDVDDAFARLLIETNHTINLLVALHQGDTNAPFYESGSSGRESAPSSQNESQSRLTSAATNPEPRAGGLPKISIASVVISNAQARFTDRSLTPNVNLAIQQAGGTISGLSSEELQHADVNLHAKVDNVGPVEITGTINPFSEHQTNELKIAVHDVDLTPASPYSGKFAGYRIAKGKLNLALAYHLQGRNLKSENQITLDQFTFGEKVDSPEATKLPVRLAVAVLKDRSGRIELDVPIEGRLDDPQFKLHKVIVHALVNVITKIVTSPFAVLGSVFGGKGEEIRYQDFTPGSTELLAVNREKLDALVKGLYERPGLQLEIEGSVDPDADREGLRRVALDKKLRTGKWQALRKSARAATTPDQIELTPEERASLLKNLYGEALEKGTIDLAKLSANTNTIALAALLQARVPKARKGATLLMESAKPSEPVPGGLVAAAGLKSGLPPVTDPVEQAVLTTMVVTDSDLEALASNRAKAVRDYLLHTGKVEPERVFLTERQTAGVKAEGARSYLQFR